MTRTGVNLSNDTKFVTVLSAKPLKNPSKVKLFSAITNVRLQTVDCVVYLIRLVVSLHRTVLYGVVSRT